MIVVFYKCRCMKEERSVGLRERGDGEDIRDWVESVVRPGVTDDHQKASPLCRAEALEFVKIPAPEGRPIGKPPVHH